MHSIQQLLWPSQFLTHATLNLPHTHTHIFTQPWPHSNVMMISWSVHLWPKEWVTFSVAVFHLHWKSYPYILWLYAIYANFWRFPEILWKTTIAKEISSDVLQFYNFNHTEQKEKKKQHQQLVQQIFKHSQFLEKRYCFYRNNPSHFLHFHHHRKENTTSYSDFKLVETFKLSQIYVQ